MATPTFQLREIRPYTDRVRVHFHHPMTVRATPEEIFPLLCPVREFDWIPHWDCKLVYTESGVAERNCIFQTNTGQTDKPGEGVDTWVVSHHEPPQRISFVRVDDQRTIQYDVFLEAVPQANGGDTTKLDWHQEITALHEDGDRFVRELKASDFSAMIEKVEAMLEYFLRHGEPLQEAA